MALGSDLIDCRGCAGVTGDRRVISSTPNWPRMALGSDLIDCRGCAVWPSVFDPLHLSLIGIYAKDGLGITKRICPFGGENSTAKQVIHQGPLIEVFPQFHYAVLVAVDVEKFGFLKDDLIYWIRESGLLKDFSAMVEAEARFPQAREDHGFPISPWTDLTTYNGWTRSVQEAYEVAHHGEEEDHHKQSSTHEKDEEPTQEEEHSLPVMRLIGRGIYHNLTNHIRRSKAAAIINEGVNAMVMSRIREVVYGNNNTDLPPLLSEQDRPYLPASFCPRLPNELDLHDVDGFDKAWDEWEARVYSV
eukprot:CAMPEP_0197301854 /NCGR_PEP_ID=MMETSP0890-20130614/50661_1 /TAXON_ID=44058 ORGANISM="Aureoumbra lagunensis, Strain CCMP1510" /NCGR_SAMPLE_ID=MMETSP0890 /ASSEMBLY_ACC=CAM_ASM_000533 /LENGTH=302 /DNA_ID=CAMNT_0042781265 /DNA_START=457 /DNA_END=1365 /DNA_ORIENTATION=-